MIRRGDRGRGTRNEFDAEPAVPLRGRGFFFWFVPMVAEGEC